MSKALLLCTWAALCATLMCPGQANARVSSDKASAQTTSPAAASPWLEQAWYALEKPVVPRSFKHPPQPQSRLRLWHKILGIAATTLLLATSIVGDKNVLDEWDNRLPSQGWRSAHQGLVIGTSALYLASQVVGWLDPLKFRSPALGRWFRILRWIHTIGFVTLIGLGLLTARLTPGATTGKIIASVAHMSTGYITLGALGLGTLLLFF